MAAETANLNKNDNSGSGSGEGEGPRAGAGAAGTSRDYKSKIEEIKARQRGLSGKTAEQLNNNSKKLDREDSQAVD